jgi:hypothetical protein
MKPFFISFLVLISSSAACALDDSLFVSFFGDTVKVWNTRVHENCAARFAFSIVFLDSSDIVITECDTVRGKANCDCIFDLRVSFVSLIPANYTVTVYRQYLKQYGYSVDTTILIGSTSFVLANFTPLPAFSISRYQSPCGGVPVAVKEERPATSKEEPISNFPNPFNPSTDVRFTIATFGAAELRVYDVLGHEVTTLVDKSLTPGEYTIHWDAANFPGGVYFYRLVAEGHARSGRMMLLK